MKISNYAVGVSKGDGGIKSTMDSIADHPVSLAVAYVNGVEGGTSEVVADGFVSRALNFYRLW